MDRHQTDTVSHHLVQLATARSVEQKLSRDRVAVLETKRDELKKRLAGMVAVRAEYGRLLDEASQLTP